MGWRISDRAAIDINNMTNKTPYLGGEKAPRPYRDWYVLVVIGLSCLIGLIAIYGYVMLKITNHEALASDILIERSLQKVKLDELDKITTKIEEQEDAFLQVVASSTPVVDPSH